MVLRKIFSAIVIFILRIIFYSKKKNILPINPVKFLIIRQHNQFGDMLATIPLFRAIKETYPHSEITLIASPENHFAVTKNEYIKEVFNFNKKLLKKPSYIKSFISVLRRGYDVTIVPATVSISSTSCIMARISKSKLSVGPSSLDGAANKLDFLFDIGVNLDWRKNPEMNVSQFCLDILKPLNISTNNYKSCVTFDNADVKMAEEFLNSFGLKDNKVVAGFHVGAGKPPNRWPLEKYVKLIELLKKEYNIKFYFTGSNSDKDEIGYMKEKFKNEASFFLNKSIPELAAVISRATIFITNDTGVMHVAGATNTPQISIFGPTNPNNWAPIGDNKFFLRKNEDINSIEVSDVYNLAVDIITKQLKK